MHQGIQCKFPHPPVYKSNNYAFEHEGVRKKMILLMLFDFSRESVFKFGVWMRGKGVGVGGWRENFLEFPGIFLRI